jgi:Beta-galactosidase
MMGPRVIAFAFALVCANAVAWIANAQEATRPVGIYSSGGPTTANRNSVDSRLEGQPYVDGVLVRISWADVEPRPGVYDWARLDDQFSRAQRMGIKVSLGVVNGLGAPAWLADRGAMMFAYSFHGTSVQMPVPWDPVFLERWTSFVQAMGQRYDRNPALSLVHITTSTANGFEMQLPSMPDDQRNWKRIGYTTDAHVNAYHRVIDAFGRAFPSKAMDLEVHPVLNSDTVAQQVVAYANQKLGARFGVFAGWWSQRNADAVYPGMHTLLKEQAARTFATVQLATNATHDPNGFGAGGFQVALDRAYSDGVRYFEIWDIDLLNSNLTPAIRSLHTQSVSGPAKASTGTPRESR